MSFLPVQWLLKTRTQIDSPLCSHLHIHHLTQNSLLLLSLPLPLFLYVCVPVTAQKQSTFCSSQRLTVTLLPCSPFICSHFTPPSCLSLSVSVSLTLVEVGSEGQYFCFCWVQFNFGTRDLESKPGRGVNAYIWVWKKTRV